MNRLANFSEDGLSKKLHMFLQKFNGYYFERVIKGLHGRSFADDVMKYFYTSAAGRELRKALEQHHVPPEVPGKRSRR